MAAYAGLWVAALSVTTQLGLPKSQSARRKGKKRALLSTYPRHRLPVWSSASGPLLRQAVPLQLLTLRRVASDLHQRLPSPFRSRPEQ